MKLYFNNKEYFFKDNNISSYHLLLKSLEKINEKWQNMDNYYITTTEGFPMKPSQVIEKDKTYYLKKRLKGSNSLYEKGNSYVITILGSIFFGILSIVYYNFYLTKIIVQIPEDIQEKLNIASAPDSTQPLKNKLQGMKSLSPQGLPKGLPKGLEGIKGKLPKGLEGKMPQGLGKGMEGLEGKMPQGLGKGLEGKMPQGLSQGFGKMRGGVSVGDVRTGLGNFGLLVKSYWNKFLGIVNDDNLVLKLCNTPPIVPNIVLQKKQKSWGSILSFALFSTYIFMLLMPMITNAATTISCKSPGFSKLGIPLLLMLIPLILVFVLPFLLKGLDKLMEKLKIQNPPNFRNYKLAMSNTILIVILIIFLATGKNNISPLMGCMVIIGLILFALIKYIPTINNIIASAATHIGNWITNTTPIPANVDMTKCDVKLDKLNNFTDEQFNEAFENKQPDCWMRYRFLFEMLWSIVMTLLGWGLMVGVYASQVRKHCKVA